MSTSTSSNASSNPFTVHVNWRETPAAHIINADIPGVDANHVKVATFDDGFLEISGDRVVELEEEAEEDSVRHLAERIHGKFMRKLELPENANLVEFDSVLEKGVLIVTVPKKLPGDDQVAESSEGSDDDDQVDESSEGSDDRDGFYVDEMLAELTGF